GDRGGPDPRRSGAGRGRWPARGDGLRRAGAAPDRHLHGLPSSHRDGAAGHRDRAPRVPVAAQPARRQGRRRGRRHLAARRHRQRGRGRAGAVRRPRDPDAARPVGGAGPAGEVVKPAPFEYAAPRTLDEAVGALASGGDAKVLAGGQSLVPMLALRLARPTLLVDINRLPGLDGIREASGMLEIGALVRQRALERWAAGRSPLFSAVLQAVAHPPIRNRGTVVGNVVHADPASELPALLLCLEGVVVARGPRGERMIAADRFYRAPLTTALDGHELATAVRFTLPPAGAGWGFAEVSRRHGDFALVGAVAVLARAGTVARARLAFFGAGGTPVRGGAAERALEGRAPTPALIGEAARAAAAG